MTLGLPKLVERYISPEPNSGCWLWTASLNKDGYGFTAVGGVCRSAHRAVYEYLVVSIPEGFEPDHLCRVRCCVNPDHIEPVTKQENMRRGVGASAINARRVECKNGHPFDTLNTIHRKGRRYCRACVIKASSAWQKRNRDRVNRRYHDRKSTKPLG